jgi:hypothetical protein
VALVKTDVSEERIASIIKVRRIGVLETTEIILIVLRLLATANVVPSLPSFVALMMEAWHYSETSVLTRVTRRNIPEDGILHSHRLENSKFYTALTSWIHIYMSFRENSNRVHGCSGPIWTESFYWSKPQF